MNPPPCHLSKFLLQSAKLIDLTEPLRDPTSVLWTSPCSCLPCSTSAPLNLPRLALHSSESCHPPRGTPIRSPSNFRARGSLQSIISHFFILQLRKHNLQLRAVGGSHYLLFRLSNRKSLAAAREAMKQRDAQKGGGMRDRKRGVPDCLVSTVLEVCRIPVFMLHEILPDPLLLMVAKVSVHYMCACYFTHIIDQNSSM